MRWHPFRAVDIMSIAKWQPKAIRNRVCCCCCASALSSSIIKLTHEESLRIIQFNILSEIEQACTDVNGVYRKSQTHTHTLNRLVGFHIKLWQQTKRQPEPCVPCAPDTMMSIDVVLLYPLCARAWWNSFSTTWIEWKCDCSRVRARLFVCVCGARKIETLVKQNDTKITNPIETNKA